MQILRTVIWVLLLVALLLFSIANWEPIVTVRIWQNLVVDTKIPAIVVVSFLIGLVPMWLLLRAREWQLKRRIANLENATRTAVTTPVARTTEEDVEHVPEPAPVTAPVTAPVHDPDSGLGHRKDTDPPRDGPL